MMNQGYANPQQKMGMRAPTGYGGPQQIDSVGFQTDVHIPERLVTQHGLTGISMGKQGPVRQIYDRTYYLNVIKKKNGELSNEIQKMKNEVEEISKDNQTFVTLERKFEELSKEVRTYEGELADYNLALDKYRSDTKPEDIIAILYHIQGQNEKQRGQLDEMFIDRKEMEGFIHELEEQIAAIDSVNEEKLNGLEPEKRNIYEKLKHENTELQIGINAYRNELEEVNLRLGQADNRLRSDVIKQRAQQLREEKYGLMKKKEELELLTDEMNLPFPEARERLLAKSKEDQMEIKSCENRMMELKKLVDSYQKQIKDIESELEERKNESASMQKYEILHQKDQEISEFMNSFEETKTKELGEIETLEGEIFLLLEQMSKHLRRQQNLPSLEENKKMGEDLDSKKRGIDAAEQTYVRLQGELKERTKNLERLDGLDAKVAQDTKTFTEKMENMKEEMLTKFTRIDELRSEYEGKKSRLQKLKKHYSAFKDPLNQQVQYLEMKIEGKKKQLEKDDTYKQLQGLENKMGQNEGNIYTLRQFIDAKNSESNYEQIMNHCLNITHNINADVIKDALTVKPF